MFKLGTMVKVGALSCALALSTPAVLAASTFQVPLHYTVELVDGQTSDFGYNRFTREITLSPGRHQLVLLFEGSFGTSRDARLVQAANPVVIDFNNMADNASYSFTYKHPKSESEAELYTRSQKISLINDSTKAPLSSSEASYFILTSDSGFAIFRDYKDDLASVGRLYAPKATAASRAEIKSYVNDQGVQTIQAHASPDRYVGGASTGAAVGMSSTVNTAAQEVKTPSSEPEQVQASSHGISYATLVDMYNKADDKTKLQFVKYIMTH